MAYGGGKGKMADDVFPSGMASQLDMEDAGPPPDPGAFMELGDTADSLMMASPAPPPPMPAPGGSPFGGLPPAPETPPIPPGPSLGTPGPGLGAASDPFAGLQPQAPAPPGGAPQPGLDPLAAIAGRFRQQGGF